VLLAPLVNDARRSVSSVDLVIDFGGQALVLVLAEVAGVPKQGLSRAIGSVIDREDEIRRALDRLFTGF
jgi:toxin CcdB